MHSDSRRSLGDIDHSSGRLLLDGCKQTYSGDSYPNPQIDLIKCEKWTLVSSLDSLFHSSLLFRSSSKQDQVLQAYTSVTCGMMNPASKVERELIFYLFNIDFHILSSDH